MAIPDEDVAQVRAATDIVALIGEHAALKRVGPALDRPVPVPHREDPLVQRQRRGGLLLLLRLPGLGRRHHLRAGDRAPRLRRRRAAPGRPGRASRSTRTPRRGRTASAGPSSSTPWSGPSSGTTSGCCARPTPARPGTTCARAGYDGEVVRQFRLGWAPDDWDALSKRPEALRAGADRLGAGLRQPAGPGPGRLPGPGPLPDLRPLGPAGGPGGPDPPAAARASRRPDAARAQVQELPGDGHLLQAAHALRAQLGQARRDRPGRGRGVRGLHRRHRLLPGRGAPGRGHLRHRPGRGALHPAAQLRPAHRAGLRRRQRRPERDLAGLRVGAQARGRRGGGRPARRERPGGPGPQRSRGPGPGRGRGPAVPAVPGGPRARAPAT